MLTGKEWEQVCRNSPDDALVKILGSSTQPGAAVYAAQAELIRRSEISPCPNLDKWRAELAAGLRTVFTFDELWRRACEEVDRIEMDAVLRRRPPSNSPLSVDPELGF